MAGTTGLRYTFGRNESAESPLFERNQLHQDEFAEAQQLRHMAESLQQRIAKLERINTDLEARLEEQAKQSMAMESECLSIERKWKTNCVALDKEIEKLKADFQSEKGKGDKVREQLQRTERELYGILQRKYELMRGPASIRPGVGSGSSSTPRLTDPGGLKRESSWDEFSNTKPKEPKKNREKRALTNLSDFLGF